MNWDWMNCCAVLAKDVCPTTGLHARSGAAKGARGISVHYGVFTDLS